MGRPALHMKTTLIRVPQETLDTIDTLVGTHQRSKFIRAAIDNEIFRREHAEVVAAAEGMDAAPTLEASASELRKSGNKLMEMAKKLTERIDTVEADLLKLKKKGDE